MTRMAISNCAPRWCGQNGHCRRKTRTFYAILILSTVFLSTGGAFIERTLEDKSEDFADNPEDELGSAVPVINLSPKEPHITHSKEISTSPFKHESNSTAESQSSSRFSFPWKASTVRADESGLRPFTESVVLKLSNVISAMGNSQVQLFESAVKQFLENDRKYINSITDVFEGSLHEIQVKVDRQMTERKREHQSKSDYFFEILVSFTVSGMYRVSSPDPTDINKVLQAIFNRKIDVLTVNLASLKKKDLYFKDITTVEFVDSSNIQTRDYDYIGGGDLSDDKIAIIAVSVGTIGLIALGVATGIYFKKYQRKGGYSKSAMSKCSDTVTSDTATNLRPYSDREQLGEGNDGAFSNVYIVNTSFLGKSSIGQRIFGGNFFWNKMTKSKKDEDDPPDREGGQSKYRKKSSGDGFDAETGLEKSNGKFLIEDIGEIEIDFEEELKTEEIRGECFAPPGKLGVAIDTIDGVPVVHKVKIGSPLEGILRHLDRIIEIDGIDTSSMSGADVTKLMVSKMKKVRKITFLRGGDFTRINKEEADNDTI